MAPICWRSHPFLMESLGWDRSAALPPTWYSERSIHARPHPNEGRVPQGPAFGFIGVAGVVCPLSSPIRTNANNAEQSREQAILEVDPIGPFPS